MGRGDVVCNQGNLCSGWRGARQNQRLSGRSSQKLLGSGCFLLQRLVRFVLFCYLRNCFRLGRSGRTLVALLLGLISLGLLGLVLLRGFGRTVQRTAVLGQ